MEAKKKNKYKAWTNEELEFVKSNYERLSNKEMAARLGRSKSSIEGILNGRLNITRTETRRWTNEETEFLKNNFMKYTNQELADILGRSKSSIHGRIHSGLGLKRTATTEKKIKYVSGYIMEFDGVNWKQTGTI